MTLTRSGVRHIRIRDNQTNFLHGLCTLPFHRCGSAAIYHARIGFTVCAGVCSCNAIERIDIMPRPRLNLRKINMPRSKVNQEDHQPLSHTQPLPSSPHRSDKTTSKYRVLLQLSCAPPPGSSGSSSFSSPHCPSLPIMWYASHILGQVRPNGLLK